jgi:hypothetical protein
MSSSKDESNSGTSKRRKFTNYKRFRACAQHVQLWAPGRMTYHNDVPLRHLDREGEARRVRVVSFSARKKPRTADCETAAAN